MEDKIRPTSVDVAIFPAPEGDRRQTVKDYMLRAANVEWTPSEDFTIRWKDTPEFDVGIEYKKGDLCRGVTYSKAHGDLCEFASFLTENDGKNVFTPNSPYYEELVGMHCSDSITMAYQQLWDFPFRGSLKPCLARGKTLSLVKPLKQPSFDGYYCGDVLEINPKTDVFEAYANADTGDVLFKKKSEKSGHSRMVSEKPHVERDLETGLIDPENSYVLTVEATNRFDETRTDGVKTTWWIDHKYTFSELYSTFFIPVTFEAFEPGIRLGDAYLFYEGENGKENVTKHLNGTVFSNFPLIFVKATFIDKDGKIAAYALKYQMVKDYVFDLSGLDVGSAAEKLGSGKYTFILTAGIARGKHDFIKTEIQI